MLNHYYYQPSTDDETDAENKSKSARRKSKRNKRHSKGRLKHTHDVNQEDIADVAETDEVDKAHKLKPPKHHTFLKMVIGIVLILALILSIFTALMYLYVKNVPLANDNGRTNILILGVDDTANLSDTIMLLSIDNSHEVPKTALLSIPRDLYVPIPEFGSAKINAAYAYGENNNYDGGGLALSMATIESVLDINIHYHISLDFDDFANIIDSLGGVEVEVLRDLNDQFYPDDRGGYEPLYIPAGTHHMDGEMALKYARSRQTTNDFDRAFRQQQILLATKDAALNLRPYQDIESIRELASIIGGDIATNISLPQALNMADLLRQVNVDETPHYVLDTSNFLSPIANEAGASLVPASGNLSSIQQFVANIFNQKDIKQYPSFE
ncbi:MAG: LCP family protein [Candidatus Saccharimonadales bacterium]